MPAMLYKTTEHWLQKAQQVIDRCHTLALCTEEPCHVTRTFLSPPMHQVHAHVTQWMTSAGLQVSVDALGNIRGRTAGMSVPFYIGSHLDTVPHAGSFDGILGVMMGIALAESSEPKALPAIEVIGFSEEEGVRFGVPFIGSRAFVGDFPADLLAKQDRDGITVETAIRNFGLNPECISAARADPGALGYLEFHIEQGPVLESENQPVAVVDAIVGQTRQTFSFGGQPNHAGTTPMHLRRDALTGAAEWVQAVERYAQSTPGLLATVGKIEAKPGAGNVIAGLANASLDLRHASDNIRHWAAEEIAKTANTIAERRGLTVSVEAHLDQSAVKMDAHLTSTLLESATALNELTPRLNSGAGHDAMIIAPVISSAMLFLRSPGGISHHPDETVLLEDVALALQIGDSFLRRLGETL